MFLGKVNMTAAVARPTASTGRNPVQAFLTTLTSPLAPDECIQVGALGAGDPGMMGGKAGLLHGMAGLINGFGAVGGALLGGRRRAAA